MGTALILHAGAEFLDSAQTAKRHLAAKGFTSTVHSFEYQSVDSLPHMATKVDITAWYSHGGWDGPLFFFSSGQISRGGENAGEWATLQAWFRAWVVEGGLFVSHACHSAGSNRYESTDGYAARRWVGDVASDMGVYAVGVEGSTSSADRHHAVALLDFALSASRARQAARAYQPGGVLAQPWHGWLTARRQARGAAGTR
ncbi:MAG: hypothetical protein IPH07_08330 [Deltaproteobacteria bacterium]|nr:hypothetical protein [Deltaproteobacteria bacterium]MBK8236746.1 hypothetical protein [Deltaproteobacteria bacterium]MBK8720040.1 hypothetical protein [Deltaproteobacteria bacterium]MBP7289407.1 hypothetical protein [Nannocystaceae bacterium]